MRSLVVVSGRSFVPVLLVLSLILIAFLAYRPFLSNFFTAADTLTLIETSRVESFSDIVRIFTSPLMGKTDFLDFATFYRPVSALSFSFNYYLFDLNPFGYHLTNLLLHIAVTLAVFLLLRALAAGTSVAWLTALLFTIHPIIVESVPAISRRQDVIATLFLLLSMLSFLKAEKRPNNGKRFLGLSLVLYAVALGAKEIASILPFLVFFYIALRSFPRNGFSLALFLDAVRRSYAYFLVTFLFVVWRSFVLGGVGGYSLHRSGSNVRESIMIVKDYFLNLFAPVPIGFFPVQILGILALGICAALIFSSKQSSSQADERHAAIPNVLRLFFMWVTPALILLVVFNPLLVALIAPSIESAYRSEGSGILVSAMEGRDSHPVGYYLELAEYGVRLLSVVGALFSLGLIALLSSSARPGFAGLLGRVTRTSAGRNTLFFSLWLLLPLGIYLLTQTFHHHCGYISVIPVSAILSLGICGGARSLYRYWVSREGAADRFGLSLSSGGVSFISGCLCLYLISFSPLFRTYGEWEDSGKILSECLALISKVQIDSPESTILQIEDLPWGVASHWDDIPHAKLVTYLQGYSIESWLELTQGREIEVSVESMSRIPSWPINLSLTTKEKGEGGVKVAFVMD